MNLVSAIEDKTLTWTAKPVSTTFTVTLTGGANATLSGGDSTQSGLSGAMSTVTYTANSGYHFAEFTAITTTGITMTRTSDTVITISGTPTADTNITVPDAVADSASITYTLVPAKPATCTATGNKEYYTGSDGKYYTKNDDTYTETTLDAVTIAKTAHTLTAVAAVDAKCTTDGTKAHYKCSVCEKLFEDADGKTETTADALKIAALGHNYVGGTCTRCGATEPYNGGHYAPYIPSGNTTTTTTTTTTNTTPDITKYTITGKQDELNESALKWDSIPNASDYALYIKVDGKYVFVQNLGKATTADIVLSTSGKYYVSTGEDYTIYKYDSKTGKFTKTGTLKASKIENIKKANNVTEDFMVKYTINGKESAEKDSYKVSVKIYYKPAVKVTVNKGSITLKWNKVPEATKYRVYKYVNGSLKLITETTKRSVRITGTKSGKEYSYAVKALVDGKWTKVYGSDIATVTGK